MLAGRPAVFISCSGVFQERVAEPLKIALDGIGVHGIIVADEPRFATRAWDPESKIESYLRSSEAFVALVTPDDRLDDGRYRCRPNIVDELGRARSDPHLSEHMIILKSPDVDLWSDINPTYDRLDVNDPGAAIQVVINQMRFWNLLPARTGTDSIGGAKPAPEPSGEATSHVATLLEGLDLGAHDEAQMRIYELFLLLSRQQQEDVVDEIVHIATTTGDHVRELLACSLLEAADRLDPTLVKVEIVQALATSDDFSLRSSAAVLLWQWAEASPGQVPLALLGQLARPTIEDWYVQAPAMAAVKQLMLRRASGRVIFDRLAASADPEERYGVATDLLDVAMIMAVAVPRGLAEQLARDSAVSVARKGAELIRAISGVTDEDYRRYFGAFGS